MVRASRIGFRVFRNNVAKAWVGKAIGPFKRKTKVTLDIGDVVIKRARRLHAGLHKGSSDLIGWRTITITEQHLGKSVAIFTALEIKRSKKSKATKEQQNFLDIVEQSGGYAHLLSDPDELSELYGGDQ